MRRAVRTSERTASRQRPSRLHGRERGEHTNLGFGEFHLQHRTTRDLDLFWHGMTAFAREPEDCIERLQQAGTTTHVIQRTAGFVRLRAEIAGEAVIVDLVDAGATAALERFRVELIGKISKLSQP